MREGYVSAELSETFAGYWAYLTTMTEDGTVLREDSVPCRTKDDAEEIINKFINGEYNAEG